MSVVASSATYISTEFNMSEIFVVMTDQIKHNFRNVQFKHTFLPVLGEFLFYAATQEENEDKLIPNWEPTGDKLNEFGLWDDVFYLKFFCKIFHEKSSANLQQKRTDQISGNIDFKRYFKNPGYRISAKHVRFFFHLSANAMIALSTFYGAILTDELFPLAGIALMRFCERILHIYLFFHLKNLTALKFVTSSRCVNVAERT